MVLKPWKSLALAVVLLGSGALALEREQSPARSEVEEPRRPLTTSPAPPVAPTQARPASRSGKVSLSLGEQLVLISAWLLFMAGFFYLFIRLGLWLMKLQEKPPHVSPLLPRREELAPLEQRLKQVSALLAHVEEALLRKENDGLRVRFNQARKAEQNARQSLESARRGIAPRSAVTPRIDKAHKKAEAALADARRLLGNLS